MTDKLGLDVVGVIIDGRKRPDYMALDEAGYLGLRSIDGVFESVRRLTQERFGERVWLISKCSERIEAFLRSWMREHRFFERTGVLPAHLVICRERADKAVHCRELGITHFMDNRLEVLSHMVGIVSHLYLFRGIDSDRPEFSVARGSVVGVADWEEAVEALLSSERQT